MAKAVEANAAGNVLVTSNPADLKDASHIILPGVGAFGDCAQGLCSLNGMTEALVEQVLEKQKWFLGVCVGMQLLANKGLEFGEHNGLGWIPGTVEKMDTSTQPELRLPQMGWNTLQSTQSCPLLNGLPENPYFYFVHSYHFNVENEKDIAATVDYAGPRTAIVQRENIFGTQFHPEKSQANGLQLLKNFVEL